MNHGFAPIENQDARVLILGTGPSVVSLQKEEYYGHPTNAFWPILMELFHTECKSYAEKKQLLLSHQIALWDTLKAFDRKGSLDSNYTEVVPNDIKRFLESHPNIIAVGFTGKKAEEFYRRFVHFYPGHISFQALPSPSAANTMKRERKREIYQDFFQRAGVL